MKKIKLPEEYVAVLRYILRSGQQDLTALAESMRMSSDKLLHIVQNLQHKGLILVNRSTYADGWVRLSSKGQRLVKGIWPEVSLAT